MIIQMLLATVVHWAVPSMSDEMRLPDAEPKDGEKGGVVRIVAAKGEYEPGSFVVKSDTDLGKVRLEIGDFKREEGRGKREEGSVVFPAANLDLKVVKVWYQNLNGWFSYFGDTGDFKLVPELLVHDEDLIRVDTKTKSNYARLVGKDGKVREKWLNPPRELDVRREISKSDAFETFLPMRPDFADAETLQPVTLGKGECKQFFLTAKVPKDAKAGVYRGEVKVKGLGLQWSVPVEIRVLDFTLPRPKCFDRPERDLYVCSYSYISFDYLMMLNGGDRTLARRQLEAVLRNQVEHGQDMHWFRWGLNSGSSCDIRDNALKTDEFLATVKTMEKVGMRTKPLVGWMVSGSGSKEGPEALAEAQRRADEMKALLGHSDMYLGWGDEPQIDGLVKGIRPGEKTWQEAGFKFILAADNLGYERAGHVLDWHNCGGAPESEEFTRPWRIIGGDTRIAWYAAQHVGAENPAFNRRQNGLSPWLSGYSALCNYAHHFGPYNDDSQGYRPMVFAYGISGGVLDTLQWEGFREGVDDIRYGSLLVALARKAEQSADVRVRRQGKRAMAYLATFDRAKDELNAARAEMIRLIEGLIASVGQLPDDPPFDQPTIKYEPPKEEFGERHIHGETYSALAYGQYAELEPVFDREFAAARAASKPLEARKPGNNRLGRRGPRALWVGRDIKWTLGKRGEVKDIVAYALKTDDKLAPADVAELKLSAALQDQAEKTPDEIAAFLAKNEPAFAAGMKGTDRLQVLQNVASAASAALDERIVRGIALYLKRMAPQEERRLYTVRYSAHPVTGPDSWTKLGFEPERQTMSRDYGGGKDIFLTDVTTGGRGAGVEGELKTRPELSVVCDDWGVHFRFVDPDEKARAIELGLIAGGTYEAYLAPGKGRPYACFLTTPDDRPVNVFNSTYDMPGVRAIDAKDPEQVRSRTVIADGAIVTYVSFAWGNWAARIPNEGDRWDFEVVRWGRAGSAAWNGLKSIHGRSTWGELAFALPASARLGILRRQVVRAKRAFVAENGSTRFHSGLVDLWRDSDVGDPKFYDEALKPFIAELEGCAAEVTEEMTDETVRRLYETALPKWQDLRFEVARRRLAYLQSRK